MRGFALALVVAVGGIAACEQRAGNGNDGGFDGGAPPPTGPRTVVLPTASAEQRPDAPDATIVVPPPSRSVRLIQAGKPPLVALAYRYQTGEQEVALAGTLELRAVVSVAPAASGDAELLYRSPAARPGALAFGPWRVSAGMHGEIGGIRIGWRPRDLGDVEIAQRVAALAPIPLPAEPVGAGAEWIVRYELAAGAEEQTYRVLELGDGRATLDIEIAQQRAAGNEGRALRGEGAAELRLDLPVAGYNLVYVPADQPRGHVTAPLVSLRLVAVPPAAREALPR